MHVWVMQHCQWWAESKWWSTQEKTINPFWFFQRKNTITTTVKTACWFNRHLIIWRCDHDGKYMALISSICTWRVMVRDQCNYMHLPDIKLEEMLFFPFRKPEKHLFFLPIVVTCVCMFYMPAGEPRFSSSFMDLAKMHTNATAYRSHGIKDY